MGIYDRDYVRDEPRGIFLSGDWSAVAMIIVANVAVFFLDQVLDLRLANRFALQADLFSQWPIPPVWELVTHGFLHADLMHLLFNMLALGFLGRDVEGIYGKKRFLQLYFSLLILAGLCWIGSHVFLTHSPNATAVGASGAITGVVLIFVLHFPKRMIFIWGVIPVPAWLLGTLWVGGDLLVYSEALKAGENASGVGVEAHLGGALFGYVFYRYGWTLFNWWPRRLSRFSLKSSTRPRLRVHDPAPEADNEPDLDAEVDRILEKIHNEGSDSLTRKEKRTLEAASKRARRKVEMD